MILSVRGKAPVIAKNVFIAPTAVVIGDVTIGAGASIWYGTVLRGDVEPIIIGEDTNIQDNCTVHTDPGFPAVIAPRVTVGHNAVIHGCTLEEGCLVGIGAMVLSGAMVETEAVVAAGSVVRQGQRVESRQLVAGVPAKPVRELTPEQVATFSESVSDYKALWPTHVHDTKIVPS